MFLTRSSPSPPIKSSTPSPYQVLLTKSSSQIPSLLVLLSKSSIQKTTRLSRQWLWWLFPRIRNPIWIKATNTQESNSWTVQWQRSTMYHLSPRYKLHDKPIRDLLSCGRGQQTVSLGTKPLFGRKQSKSFGILREKSSLQFEHISKKIPYIYIH